MTDLERAEPEPDPDLKLDLPRHQKPQVVLSYAAQFHYRGRPRPKEVGAVEAAETMARSGVVK